MSQNVLVANVKYILVRNDKIHKGDLPKFNELSQTKKQKLKKFIKSAIAKPDTIYMHLFYSGDPIFKGCLMQVIRGLKCSIENGNIVLSCKVKFNFTQHIKPPDLREKILDSFHHWSNRADIEYGLKKFNVVSKKYQPYEKISSSKLPIYHNLL